MTDKSPEQQQSQSAQQYEKLLKGEISSKQFVQSLGTHVREQRLESRPVRARRSGGAAA